jgi:hypothetical protein
MRLFSPIVLARPLTLLPLWVLVGCPSVPTSTETPFAWPGQSGDAEGVDWDGTSTDPADHTWTGESSNDEDFEWSGSSDDPDFSWGGYESPVTPPNSEDGSAGGAASVDVGAVDVEPDPSDTAVEPPTDTGIDFDDITFEPIDSSEPWDTGSPVDTHVDPGDTDVDPGDTDVDPPTIEPMTSDVDGDGFSDLVVGYNGGLFAAGGLVLYEGSASGLSTGARSFQHFSQGPEGTTIDVLGGNEDAIAMGGELESFDGVGRAIAFGDFDDDGVDSMVVAAPGDSVLSGFMTPTLRENAGGFHILTCDPGAAYADCDAVWYTQDFFGGFRFGAAADDERFGSDIAVGDFDGDGRLDLVVGAEGEGRGGEIVVGFGDGTGGFTESVYLHQGYGAGLNTIYGAQEIGDKFGSSLAVGDFDGDGSDDIAVAAPEEGVSASQEGFIHVLRGGSRITWELDSTTIDLADLDGGATQRETCLGEAMVSADFNGDGFDDLAIGMPFCGTALTGPAQRVFVVFGSAGGLDLSTTLSIGAAIVGATASNGFGSSLAAGYINGDDYADLVIGSPEDDSRTGAVYVINGAFTGLATALSQRLTAQSLDFRNPGSTGDAFGTAVSVVDLSGDGRAEVAIGAPGKDGGASSSPVTNVGAVYVATPGRLGWTAQVRQGSIVYQALGVSLP